jgi:hypothetical protein
MASYTKLAMLERIRSSRLRRSGSKQKTKACQAQLFVRLVCSKSWRTTILWSTHIFHIPLWSGSLTGVALQTPRYCSCRSEIISGFWVPRSWPETIHGNWKSKPNTNQPWYCQGKLFTRPFYCLAFTRGWRVYAFVTWFSWNRDPACTTQACIYIVKDSFTHVSFMEILFVAAVGIIDWSSFLHAEIYISTKRWSPLLPFPSHLASRS